MSSNAITGDHVFKIVKPATEGKKLMGTTLDTIEVTPDLVRSWKTPSFQRPISHNAKLMQIVEEIVHNGGVIPGVVTLGSIDGDHYKVDGQHRCEAFLQSKLTVGYADVRILHFKEMATMAEEFVKLNQQIVKMRPDDILRGLEGSYEALSKIRKRCPFVGYDQIRRNEHTAVLSMSTAIRCWSGSQNEVPKSGGASAATLARTFTLEDAEQLIGFLDCAIAAWGREEASARLWSTLNLVLCMWLYRRLVISPYSAKTQRLTGEQFTKCLMSVSAASAYVDWLVGRHLSNRDISPAYRRLKGAFVSRLEIETGKKHLMPQPAWAAH